MSKLPSVRLPYLEEILNHGRAITVGKFQCDGFDLEHWSWLFRKVSYSKITNLMKIWLLLVEKSQQAPQMNEWTKKWMNWRTDQLTCLITVSRVAVIIDCKPQPFLAIASRFSAKPSPADSHWLSRRKIYKPSPAERPVSHWHSTKVEV